MKTRLKEEAMSRRILGIVGSYRQGGTIDQAVSAVLAAAAEGGAATEKVYLCESRIEFCTNCRRWTPPGTVFPRRRHGRSHRADRKR
jgi:multimeric flavodoxin WrbA